ncbi:hypothetical protein [Jannaschia seohaensis]|uniref:Uncharacterized protein n=1 Tax=Jannaschia seohaensis TaxID=475081 RepID=A0A2Y9AMX2_9RHOB|nr:hypothetical protein [Jannaschia seohaensis]PWJ19212.1 hypothetical protein BCF38_104144 [Jannaschia seohaensis]SSA45874.1 hypothetical protein SAMN05421539_104144 [Jannaschia seohaensis]
MEARGYPGSISGKSMVRSGLIGVAVVVVATAWQVGALSADEATMEVAQLQDRD